MADDFQNDPSEQGFPSEIDTASPYSGNRPASGARRATPGEVLSQGFQGAETAGDFLGLDTEFTASQGSGGSYAGSLDLVPPPSTSPDAQYDPHAVQAPAPLPESDPVQDFAQAPSAFEFGEDLGSEGEFTAPELKGSSKRPLLVAALLLAGLGAGGYFYGPSLVSRFLGPKTEVAVAPPAAKSKPSPAPKDTAPELAPEGDATVATLPTGEEGPAPEPVASSTEGETEPVAPRTTPTRVLPPVATLPEEEAPSDAQSGETPLGASVASPLRAVGGFPDLTADEFDWASSDKLELIWRGEEVPLDAVSSPAKTIMPRVGNVRVFTTSGDHFDGRLYAVGQNRVWIDAEPGRIGLDGDKVARIEVLPPLPEGVEASDEALLAVGGKRVRVRVPGGMLYGRVIKAEGEDVTLALEHGGRVRVKSSDLEDLGPGRAVVVRR